MSSATETLSDLNYLLSTHNSFVERIRNVQKVHRNKLRTLLHSPPESLLQLPLIRTSPSSPPPSPYVTHSCSHSATFSLSQNPKHRIDLLPLKRVRLARYAHYIAKEETFRNNFCQQYVDCGDWPQNWVFGADLEKRFEEYPKQQRLSQLKKAVVAAASLPALYSSINRLPSMPPSKFDVILIDPPYYSPLFSWEALSKLPVPLLASDPSFVFMWVGSGAGDGLERGREVLSHWGYRRCEDIVWVKTNKTTNRGPGSDPPTSSLLTRTKQHCLMGIRGTVRRSSDHWFVHCNIDTDVIIWEGDPEDPTRKPPEMYALIESFCLGARRLEIFGRRRPGHTPRRGWVTVLLEEGSDINAIGRLQVLEKEVDSRGSSVAENDEEGDMVKDENNTAIEQTGALEGLGNAMLWEREIWEKEVREACQAPVGSRVVVVPSTTEIDVLRPKSPSRGPTDNVNVSPPMLGVLPSMTNPVFLAGLSSMGNMGVARPVPIQAEFRGGLPRSVRQGPYPMMSPPMRIGHGVMNPGWMPDQMSNMPLSGMMVPHMSQVGQRGMELFPHMNMNIGTGMNLGININGMGGIVSGSMIGQGNSMGMRLNGNDDASVFQNVFTTQPGFDGRPRMNRMNMNLNVNRPSRSWGC